MDVRESVSLVPAANHARLQIAHRLDGRYGPMGPRDLAPLVHELTTVIDVTDTHVLGFPEGGIVPAFAFAQAVDRPLVVSTRFALSLPGSIAFVSSQGTQHYIHGLLEGDRVVIIEDEVTSGVTVVNAVRALRRSGIQIDHVGTLLLVDTAAVWRLMRDEKLSLHAAVRLPASYAARMGLEDLR